MKSVAFHLLFLFLLFGASCRSLFNGFGDAFTKGVLIPSLVISAEVSTITATSIAYKNSLGQWPDNRTKLSLFYSDNKESFSKDSLFKIFRFSEENFKELKFTDFNDSLIISFISSPLPDTLYQSYFFPNTKSGEMLFYKYVGAVKIHPDSSEKNKYMTEIQLDSIIRYNSDMIEYGNIYQ
ncbi:MAG: hypothetical protein JJ971_04565 [Balneolaceae bacterium]|nr:hypothetical protein [Balneolaceae bacterium]MBO6545648.1 hypothetical protein [Balneolaceae bacterium]MBO6647044.1 hypothetical protein [Balneolaceae bacterium]